MNRPVLALTSAVVVVVGVVALREQTMTRHEPGRLGTATELVVHALARNAESTTTPAELASALVLACRMEVEAEPVGQLEAVAGHQDRYRLVLAPALDEFDERQLHGCLEDARLDHLQVAVLTLQPLDPSVSLQPTVGGELGSG